MVWDRVPKGKRRARLLGKYAGDKNIEIDSKYGKEWLACVNCDFNPLTGMPCIEREPKNRWDRYGEYPKYRIHEYRFRTSSSGWIAGPNSDYCEATAETTYEGCGPMVCRDCGDVYEPSEGRRPKATLDGYLISMLLLEAGIARNEKWVNPSSTDDLRKFVLAAADRAGMLNTAAGDMKCNFGSVPVIKEMADKMEKMALELFADLAQYVKAIQAGPGDCRSLSASCREAKKRLKEIKAREREDRDG